MDGKPYPWQEEEWKKLYVLLKQHRMPYGIILRGSVGIGKFRLASCLARAIVCKNPEKTTGLSCGMCSGCSLYKAGVHPDTQLIIPEEGKLGITVEQIRNVVSYSTLSRHAAQTKVCIIAPAESLTIAAQNTLLKTLEEPPGNMVFLLVNHIGDHLLATVRSRCWLLTLSTPAFNTSVEEWLVSNGADRNKILEAIRLSRGAPLKSLELLHDKAYKARQTVVEQCLELIGGRIDPLYIAEKWSSTTNVDELLEHCLVVIQEIIYQSFDLKGRYSAVNNLPLKVPLTEIWMLYDACIESRRFIRANPSLNKRLLLENLVFKFSGSQAAYLT